METTRFWGEHEHSLDAKGRLILPARYRDRLERLVLAKGQDRCLFIYTPEEWERMSGPVAAMSVFDADARRLQRQMFSGAVEDKLDAQGRVTIPETLRRYAGLDRDVTVIGAGPRLEVWDRATWEGQQGSMDEQYAALSQKHPDLQG